MSDAPRDEEIRPGVRESTREEWYARMRRQLDPDSERRAIEEAADAVHRSVEEERSWLSEINDRWWLGPVIIGIGAALVVLWTVVKVYLG